MSRKKRYRAPVAARPQEPQPEPQEELPAVAAGPEVSGGDEPQKLDQADISEQRTAVQDDYVGTVPGLRLLARRSRRFWCIGKPLDPGVPLDVALSELSDRQLSEIRTVQDHHITVEEIEIPVYDEEQ